MSRDRENHTRGGLGFDPFCTQCDRPILGDIMVPEDEGAMHRDCWLDWLDEQDGDS